MRSGFHLHSRYRPDDPPDALPKYIVASTRPSKYKQQPSSADTYSNTIRGDRSELTSTLSPASPSSSHKPSGDGRHSRDKLAGFAPFPHKFFFFFFFSIYPFLSYGCPESFHLFRRIWSRTFNMCGHDNHCLPPSHVLTSFLSSSLLFCLPHCFLVFLLAMSSLLSCLPPSPVLTAFLSSSLLSCLPHCFPVFLTAFLSSS